MANIAPDRRIAEIRRNPRVIEKEPGIAKDTRTGQYLVQRAWIDTRTGEKLEAQGIRPTSRGFAIDVGCERERFLLASLKERSGARRFVPRRGLGFICEVEISQAAKKRLAKLQEIGNGFAAPEYRNFKPPVSVAAIYVPEKAAFSRQEPIFTIDYKEVVANMADPGEREIAGAGDSLPAYWPGQTFWALKETVKALRERHQGLWGNSAKDVFHAKGRDVPRVWVVGAQAPFPYADGKDWVLGLPYQWIQKILSGENPDKFINI